MLLRVHQHAITFTGAHKPVRWLKSLPNILYVFLLFFQFPVVMDTVYEAT